jgi:hypothetical protein
LGIPFPCRGLSLLETIRLVIPHTFNVRRLKMWLALVAYLPHTVACESPMQPEQETRGPFQHLDVTCDDGIHSR